MTAERWDRIKAVFDRVVGCDPELRSNLLADCCGDDEDLRREAESLLARDQKTGSLLDIWASATGVPPTGQPDSFGPYEPIRVLGEGGMGTVYLARQLHPIRREVALKLVKGGTDSRQVLDRFAIERQVLAIMDHPNVARVFDAGASQRGRPYFVMEYVDGIPITLYCDRNALSTRQRLELFVPVCYAIQHAHRKGVIHRDIKPSNILVTEVDGKAIPKVIDFGVARATDAFSTGDREFTLAGQIIGTPEYMSPEQTVLDSRDIDTATDIYSLGVVLYELLAGALPIDPRQGPQKGFAEVLRVVRETPVPRPTTRISQLEVAAAQEVARLRGTDLGQLKRELSGELEWVVMKAIAKDRSYRYVSTLEFAVDLEHYLHNQPVQAGPPGAAYRIRKFIARNKRSVAAGGLIFCALIIGLIMTMWQAHVARQERSEAIRERAEAEKQRVRAEQQAIESARQRDAAQMATGRASAAEKRSLEERNLAISQERRANNEAAAAKAVSDFLQNDLLAQASTDSQARPDTKPDPDIKVRTALDRAAARIRGKFDSQPLVEASIRITMGETYRELGQYPAAQREVERALELRRRLLGEEKADTLEAMHLLGMLYMDQGQYRDAELLLQRVVELEHRVLGRRNPTTLVSINHLAELYQQRGKYSQAEPLAAEVLELQRRVFGAEHPETLEAMNNLGMLYRSEGKYAAAEPLLSMSLEIKRRVLGEEHSATLMAMTNLAALYRNQRRYPEAEALLTRALETYRRVLGDDYPDTVATMSGLGGIYFIQGKFSQAEAIAIKAIEINQRVLGSEHPQTLTDLNNLAALYMRQAKYADAEPLAVKVLEARRRLLGETHPSTLNAMTTLGVLYEYEGKYTAAESLLGNALKIRRSILGPQHPDTAVLMVSFGGLLLKEEKYADAEPILREAFDYFEKFSDGWERYLVETRLGGSLAGQRKYSQAEPWLLSGYEGLVRRDKIIPKDRVAEVEDAAVRILQLYRQWGKPEQVSDWQAKISANRKPN